jgi:hypothetical protein
MPVKVQWMLQIPIILERLQALDVPVVDRSVCERVFGVRRRQAVKLMHQFGGYRSGNAVLGGRDAEDDDSYCYRIHLKLISQAGSNEAAIRFQLLQVPGIQDVVFDRQAGTLLCYVYAITPVAAASVLAMVQDSIDQTVAFPLTGTALNPDLVGITFATTITIW